MATIEVTSARLHLGVHFHKVNFAGGTDVTFPASLDIVAGETLSAPTPSAEMSHRSSWNLISFLK